MEKDGLSGRQLACITGLFIIGSSSAIGGSGISGKDTWIAMLAAMLVAVPLVLMYARISVLYGERNLFEIIYCVFGRWGGRFVSLLMLVYVLILGMLVLGDFPEFVRVVSFPKTPKLVFTTLIGFTCAYLARLGAGSFGKAGILFSAVVGIGIVLTVLMLIPEMNLKNLTPMLASPKELVALNAAKLLSGPFGETVLLLCLYCEAKKTGYSKKRAYITGLLLGGGYLVISVLRNLMALGAGNFSSLYYPSYDAVSTINIGDFLQRVEVIVSGYLLVCDIIKISVAIYAAGLGAAHILDVSDYRKLVFPIALLMIVCSPFMFKSTMELFRWYPVYILYPIPFQLAIPLILWIWAEINKSRPGKLSARITNTNSDSFI